MHKNGKFYKFVQESNAIEGILRDPTDAELKVSRRFVDTQDLLIEDLINYVDVVANAQIRDASGMNVRVGDHVPPRGSPVVRKDLKFLLAASQKKGVNPYLVHQQYETLHPFMDGNGRSGRILWYWMMKRSFKESGLLHYGFLRAWYYQSLSNYRG